MLKKILFFLLFVSIIIITTYFLLEEGILWLVEPSREAYPVRGIDISHHQGKIEWEKVPKSELDFVYIKASEGKDFRDSDFKRNWKEAKKMGFAVGAYHFFTLCKTGKDQAKNFINSVSIEEDSLPPMLDLEFTGNCKNEPGIQNVEKEIQDFLELVENTYHKKPILYLTYEFIQKYAKNKFTDYKVWIRDILRYPKTKWLIWQYKSRGRISGVKGPVDMNVFNGSREDFEKWRGLNHK